MRARAGTLALLASACAVVVFVVLGGPAIGQTVGAANSLTFHGDRTRIGWNSNETILTPANVTVGSFGPLWNSPQFDSTTINGTVYPPHMYASPLYVDSMTITGGTYAGRTLSVVFAGTSTGWVYAVNAFTTSTLPTVAAGTILWRTHLGQASPGPDGLSVGVLSTPTIDLSTAPPRIYVTADVNDASGRNWQIFALDLGSGGVLSGWPLLITGAKLAAINQNGPTLFGGTAALSQRAALNLSPDGRLLYVPLGAYGDGAPGWMIAVDTRTPALASAFGGAQTNVAFANAGMWGAGGPSIDAGGFVYESTGNSPDASGPTPHMWGNSILKWNPGTPLSLAGTYSPWNYCQMDHFDTDLSGGSPILLPDLDPLITSTPHLMVNGGKQGNAYLLNRDALAGRLDQRPPCNNDPTGGPPTDTSLLPPTGFPYYNGSRGPLNIFGPYSEGSNQSDFAKARSTPAYFRAADGTNYVFFSGSTKTGVNQTAVIPPSIVRTRVVTAANQPAYFVADLADSTVKVLSPGSPMVTSNGSADAVVWLTDANVFRSATLAGPNVPHPVLYAFDAMTLNPLWQSTPSMLNVGGKYSHPTISRGTVFVGTDSIQAFGLQNVTSTRTPTPTVTLTPMPVSTSTPTPTATPGPSTLGLTSIGTTLDTSDSNYMTGSRVMVGAQSASVSSMSVYVGAADSAPGNQFSLAIYADVNGSPGALVAKSANSTLQGNAWNTLAIAAPLSPNTAYWLVYNTNGSSGSVNNMAYNNVPTNIGAWVQQTFGTWPATFGGATLQRTQYSIYATAVLGTFNTPTLTPSPTATLTPTPSGPSTSTPTPTATATPAPSTLGLTSIGTTPDTTDSNYITGSRVVVGSKAVTASSISVYVGALDTSPRNQFSVAIYTDVNGAPAALVAKSANGTLQANAWNTLPIAAPLSPTTAYWLMYNTNGSNGSVNNMAYNTDPSNVGAWAAQTFGTWPNTFGAATLQATRYSIYAVVQ